MPSRAVTEQESRLMLKALEPAKAALRNQALFTLGCKTGFRISELLSLCVNDVVGEQGIKAVVEVRRRHMKGKKQSRSVPLHREAKEALQAYLSSEPLGSEDKLFPIGRMQAHRIIVGAARAASIQGRISSHSMRKHFGQRVYAVTGKDIVATQRALGHKSLSSTTAYLSVGQDTVDAAILA